MSRSLHYSAQVDIYLLANGEHIEVAACLENRCTLRYPRALPPCHAQLVIVIDGQERCRSVYLPDGISENSDEVKFEPDTNYLREKSV